MQIKCEYCGGYINDTDKFCPHCGGTNANIHRAAEGVPKTIEELRQYAAYHKLPLEHMRFFIGVDYKEPKAFGIYEDHGVFYVYKNKSDGSRTVRYRGTDEAYAVNELYQKMRSEVIARKQGVSNRAATPAEAKKSAFASLLRPLIIFMVAIISTGILRGCLSLAVNRTTKNYSSPSYSSGYYKYDDDLYYSNGYNWYSYQNNDWSPVTPDKNLTDNYQDYFESYSYSDSYDAESFTDSDYYSNSNSYSNDSYDDSYDDSRWDSSWDNDDSWDSYDSWDSGSTDWDSDW